MQEPGGQHADALHYWHERRATYECLADTALDLLAPPASQAGIHRTRVFRLRTADSRTPQENDKIARDASQTETNC